MLIGGGPVNAVVRRQEHCTMPNPVEATFTISRDEYVRAMRRYYKTKLQLKRDLVGSVVAILVGIYLLWSTSMTGLAWLLVIAGAISLILVIYAVALLPHLIYRYQPKLQSEYRLRFRDDAIGFHTDQIDSELKWSIYHSWLRDDEFFILYHGKRDVSVIPRRALVDGADERLTELLSQKIGPAIA